MTPIRQAVREAEPLRVEDEAKQEELDALLDMHWQRCTNYTGRLPACQLRKRAGLCNQNYPENQIHDQK